MQWLSFGLALIFGKFKVITTIFYSDLLKSSTRSKHFCSVRWDYVDNKPVAFRKFYKLGYTGMVINLYVNSVYHWFTIFLNKSCYKLFYVACISITCLELSIRLDPTFSQFLTYGTSIKQGLLASRIWVNSSARTILLSNIKYTERVLFVSLQIFAFYPLPGMVVGGLN